MNDLNQQNSEKLIVRLGSSAKLGWTREPSFNAVFCFEAQKNAMEKVECSASVVKGEKTKNVRWRSKTYLFS